MFALKNITKIFQKEKEEVEAIRNISLEIKETELVAVVGPSGCGKTTLLRIAAGLLEPTSGKVFLNEKPAIGPSKEKGLVFQQPTPFPWLKVLGNVEFGLSLQKMDAKKRGEIAQKFVDLVGLSGYEDSYIKDLSGGMKQRVSIARTLANDPKIIFMDEPFSALDTQTRALMQELLLTIWKETKKTILFVTHDIEEAIFLADRVYVMSAKPGEIKEALDINLLRPRVPEIKLSEEFINIKKHISYIIRGEAIKAAQVNMNVIRPGALKIGLHVWPGNMLFYLAGEIGSYQKHNLDIELIDVEKGGERIEIVESLFNGNLDLLNLTADSVIIAKDMGFDVETILCLNRSNGADALIARKEIRTIKELESKKIAVENRFVSHYFLLHVLDKHGLKTSDVKIQYMRSSDIGAALISGNIDAAVLWEPWLTEVKKLISGNILVSSKEEPVVLDLLVTSKKIINSRREKLNELITSWFEALDFNNQNRQKSIEIMSVPLGLAFRELGEQLSRIDFIGLEENKKLLGARRKKGSLIADLDKMSEIWHKNKIIKEKTRGEDLINNTFL